MAKANGKFFMAGSEGTGQYVVIARTARGRVGIRALCGTVDSIDSLHEARIRVEPFNRPGVVAKMAPILTGWKQPGEDGQHRFSRVVNAESAHVLDPLKAAFKAIGIGPSGLKLEVNPAAPQWASTLIAEAAVEASN